ncbi:MAG: tetratricopeptide repeat protein, partial [Verrucomicrobia subdivision 3 bacterium]|nr:tetratricopeptide repeat protein [Limisphaerales bacterium]
DPGQYPRQISDAGLQVWKVQKVYSTLLGDQSGTTNINTAQLSAQSGRTLAELAAAARGVLGGEATPSPATVGFRLLVNQVPQQLGERDIFSGLPLSPGGEARRAVHESAGNNLEAAKREAQLRRNLQAILTQAEDGGRDGRFLADFGEQTRQLEPSRAADVLVQLGERYQRQGRWELAAECFELVVERYPKSTLATRSLVWLVQYYASSEAAWRMRASQQHTIQQVTALQPARRPAIEPAPPSVGAQPAGAAAVRPEIGARADVARAGGTVVGEGELQTRLAKACGYARQIEQLQPGLYGEPVVRFPLAVAHRQQGLPGQAQKFYMALRHTRPADAWRDCALGELWLVDGKTEPPKPLCTCLRAQGKPYLDGKLEEPFWQRGKTVALHSPVRDDEAWGCVVMLAYDEEFLYWAVSCARAPGRKYVPGREARPRDADLADQDRIELLLDVDRDFATYYRLAVDSRGWTAESCWNDGSWNPQWFVAQALEQDTWTVEAAIPLAELTSQLPQAQTAWAVGLQRIVPGVGIQSWTQPATTAGRPEGVGSLVFEAAASAQ